LGYRRFRMAPSKRSPRKVNRAGKLFRYHGKRRPGGLADAKSKMPGGPSHYHNEIPAMGGTRVFHQAVDDFEAVLAGCFKAECRSLSWQGQIIIDGLGHVTYPNAAGGVLGNLTRRIHRIVSTDGYQISDVQSFESGEHPFQILDSLGRIGPRGVENRTAGE
jgi:hypothetical protein